MKLARLAVLLPLLFALQMVGAAAPTTDLRLAAVDVLSYGTNNIQWSIAVANHGPNAVNKADVSVQMFLVPSELQVHLSSSPTLQELLGLVPCALPAGGRILAPSGTAASGATEEVVLQGTNLFSGRDVPPGVVVDDYERLVAVISYAGDTSSADNVGMDVFNEGAIRRPYPVRDMVPADQATNVSVTADLSWSSRCDFDESFTVRVEEVGGGLFTQQTVSVPQLDPPQFAYATQYRWRVAIHNHGTVADTATSEWQVFSTEAQPIQAPPSPTILSPSNGSTNVLVTADGSIRDNGSGVSTATSIQWELRQGSTLIDSGTESVPPTIVLADFPTLNHNATYTLRARAANSAGTSAWVESTFATVAPPVQTPLSPTILAPTGSTVSIGADGSVRDNGFGTSAQATSLIWELKIGSTLVTAGTASVSTQNTSINFPTLNYATTYTFRAKASNSAGDSAFVSETFTTEAQPIQAPPSPTILSPSNGSTNVSVTADGSIRDNGSGVTVATSIQWELKQGSTLIDSGTESVPPTTVTADLSTLSYSTAYVLRARAANSAGTSAWVSSTFTTEQHPPTPPLDPTILAPTGTSVSVNVDGSVRDNGWSTANQAENITWQLWTDVMVASGTVSVVAQTVSIPLPTLVEDTDYNLYATAHNSDGDSNTVLRSFRTAPPPILPPLAPTILSPTNGSTNVSTATDGSIRDAGFGTTRQAASLQWELKIGSTLVDSGSQVVPPQTVTADLPTLDYATSYTLRARAHNDAGTSAWTQAVFTTEAAPVVDLQLTVVEVLATTETTVTLRAEVRNGGTLAIANDQVEVQFNLGRDDVYGNADDAFAAGRILATSGTLEPGETDSLQITGTGLSILDFCHVAAKVDHREVITEADENNNTASTQYRDCVFVQPPLAPTILSPTNGSTNVSTATDGSIRDAGFGTSAQAATIVWELSTGSTPVSSGSLVVPPQQGTADLPVLSHSTAYVLRARAHNSAGNSDWTTVTFTTQAAPVVWHDLFIADIRPVIIDRRVDDLDASIEVTVHHDGSEPLPLSTIEVQLVGSCNDIYGDGDDFPIGGRRLANSGQLLPQQSYTVTIGGDNLPTDNLGYVIGRVDPNHLVGEVDEANNDRAQWIGFCQGAPAPPELLWPQNAATDVPRTTPLVWRDPAEGTSQAAESYQVWLAPTGQPLQLVGTTTDEMFLPVLDPRLTTFRWKVVALNGQGQAESPMWVFTVDDDSTRFARLLAINGIFYHIHHPGDCLSRPTTEIHVVYLNLLDNDWTRSNFALEIPASAVAEGFDVVWPTGHPDYDSARRLIRLPQGTVVHRGELARFVIPVSRPTTVPADFTVDITFWPTNPSTSERFELEGGTFNFYVQPMLVPLVLHLAGDLPDTVRIGDPVTTYILMSNQGNTEIRPDAVEMRVTNGGGFVDPSLVQPLPPTPSVILPMEWWVQPVTLTPRRAGEVVLDFGFFDCSRYLGGAWLFTEVLAPTRDQIVERLLDPNAHHQIPGSVNEYWRADQYDVNGDGRLDAADVVWRQNHP